MKRFSLIFVVLLIFILTYLGGCIENQDVGQIPLTDEITVTSTVTPEASPPDVPLGLPSEETSDLLLTDEEFDKNAEKISIDNRAIESFDIFADCTNLKELSINSCSIQGGLVLPTIKSLERISIIWCGPVAIGTIKNNTQIQYLSLSYNEFEDINVLKDFHNLTQLYLNGNNIIDLSALSELYDLELLDLTDGNFEITTLKPLFGLDKLSRIYMNLKTFENIPNADLKHFGANPDSPMNPGPNCIIEVD